MALFRTRHLRVLKCKYSYSTPSVKSAIGCISTSNTCSLSYTWLPQSLIVLCCSDAHRLRWPSSLRPVRPVHHHLTGGRTDGVEGTGQSDSVSSGCMEFCWSVDGDGQDWPRGCQWYDTTSQRVVRYKLEIEVIIP